TSSYTVLFAGREPALKVKLTSNTVEWMAHEQCARTYFVNKCLLDDQIYMKKDNKLKKAPLGTKSINRKPCPDWSRSVGISKFITLFLFPNSQLFYHFPGRYSLAADHRLTVNSIRSYTTGEN
ncbi:hypothetical protein L9F63_020140, partial [Diploptera punctata]